MAATTGGNYLDEFAHQSRNVDILRREMAVLQEKDKKLSREIGVLKKRVRLKEKMIQKGLRVEPIADVQIRKKFEQLTDRMSRCHRARTWKYAIASFGGREQAMRGLIDLVCRQLTREEVTLKYPYLFGTKATSCVLRLIQIRDQVRSVSEVFPEGFTWGNCSVADGKYRPLDDALICLAEKLLQDQQESIFLENQKGTFHFILCADGFPQGTNPGVDFSVSLAAFRSNIHSPNNCLLILAANCKEDDEACTAFMAYLVTKIAEIEQKSYAVQYQCGDELKCEEVHFKLAFFSGDQKWLASHLG